MPLIKVEDGGGSSVELLDVDGYHVCTFFTPPEEGEARFNHLPSFKCREDDVFICAPAKSGTHWTWEIVSMLFNGKAETIPKPKVQHMLEAINHEELDCLPSPRVLNTHLHFHLLPKEAIEKKCKIIYILRNPKDVVVSLYHHVKNLLLYHYDGKWENFLPLFLDGKMEYNDWFDYVQEFDKVREDRPDIPIHLVYYEDLQENNLKEVERIAEFLGVDVKGGLCESVSEKCYFKNMVKDKMMPKEIREKIFKGEFTLFRKGEIGDWKNWFTVAQNEMFDKIYNDRMKDSKHHFRYTYS